MDELNAPGGPFYNYWVMPQGIVVMADGNCDPVSGLVIGNIAWLAQGLSRTSETPYPPMDDMKSVRWMAQTVVHSNPIGTIDQLTAETPGSKES